MISTIKYAKFKFKKNDLLKNKLFFFDKISLFFFKLFFSPRFYSKSSALRNGVGIKVQIQASDFGLRFSVFLRE